MCLQWLEHLLGMFTVPVPSLASRKEGGRKEEKKGERKGGRDGGSDGGRKK